MFIVSNRFKFSLCILSVLFIQLSHGQDGHNILEDDEFNFSVVTQTVMSLKLDTLNGVEDVPYRIYDGSLVNEKDTIYFRIDLWENPLERGDTASIASVQRMLDTTLVAVQERLHGDLIYQEAIFRNAWPARLARYDLPRVQRQAKVLLVRRLEKYYLMTVVSSTSSQHHKSINRFVHSFKLFE